MVKEVMIIDIHSLGNGWYCGVDYDGHNEGGASPIKSEEELQETIKRIMSNYKDKYTFKITDSRSKQQTLFSKGVKEKMAEEEETKETEEKEETKEED